MLTLETAIKFKKTSNLNNVLEMGDILTYGIKCLTVVLKSATDKVENILMK